MYLKIKILLLVWLYLEHEASRTKKSNAETFYNFIYIVFW